MADLDRGMMEDKAWRLFELIRGEVDDFGVLLYLIVLHEMNIYDRILDENFDIKTISNEERMTGIEQSMLEVAHDFFGSSTRKLRVEFLRRIKEVLDVYPDLKHVELFESVLDIYTEKLGKRGFFYMPGGLAEVLVEILNPKPNTEVFNPFSGVGSFVKSLPDMVKFYGQEINNWAYVISLLRLKAAGKLDQGTIEKGDTIVNPRWVNRKFENIISFPPFNQRFNDEKRSITGFGDSSSFIVGRTIKSLTENGRAILVLPNGWLSITKKDYVSQRKFLVESGILETVITFPPKLIANTGIPFSVIVLDKRSQNTKKVNFIDSSDLVETKSVHRKKVIKISDLLSSYKTELVSNHKRIVGKQSIVNNRYNLLAPRYFVDESVGVTLKKVIRPIQKKERVKRGEIGRVVRISHLKNDNENVFIDASKIGSDSLKTTGYKVLQEALLVALRFQNLKPSIFFPSKTGLIVSSDIGAFTVIDQDVDAEYLALELRKEYVQDQVQKLQSGVISRINSEDFLRVRVEIPTLKEQRAIVHSYKELTSRIERLQEDKEKLLEGKKKSEFDQFASLKHTLGRPRQNILDWSDNLLHFFDQNKDEAEVLSQKFKSINGSGLSEVFKEIKNDIIQITNILEKGEEALNVEKYKLNVLSINDVILFFNNYPSSNFRFKIKFYNHIDGDVKNRGVLSNIDLLSILIDNILTNADKHAFESYQDNNIVQIDLRDEGDVLILTIMDNGVGFPKNFTKKKFVQMHVTNNSDNGSGLGGFHIDQIARWFNILDWELNLNEDPVFKVQFVFEFEIKPI